MDGLVEEILREGIGASVRLRYVVEDPGFSLRDGLFGARFQDGGQQSLKFCRIDSALVGSLDSLLFKLEPDNLVRLTRLLLHRHLMLGRQIVLALPDL